MNESLDKVTQSLKSASAQVSEAYFLVPTAGSEDSIYRERVYCYELYHRWRNSWPEELPFSICGELDKSGHAFVNRALKPDFLVHRQGSMINLLAVEVKSAANIAANLSGAVKDLESLTYFRKEIKNAVNEPANYYAAYFWIYGLNREEWPALRKKLLEFRSSNAFSTDLISCFVHERPGTSAFQVGWA